MVRFAPCQISRFDRGRNRSTERRFCACVKPAKWCVLLRRLRRQSIIVDARALVAAQAMIGDGQVSLGNIVMKPNAKKVRRIGDGIIAGFAGSTADAFTLLERLERKLEEHPGRLPCRHVSRD